MCYPEKKPCKCPHLVHDRPLNTLNNWPRNTSGLGRKHGPAAEIWLGSDSLTWWTSKITLYSSRRQLCFTSPQAWHHTGSECWLGSGAVYCCRTVRPCSSFIILEHKASPENTGTEHKQPEKYTSGCWTYPILFWHWSGKGLQEGVTPWPLSLA